MAKMVCFGEVLWDDFQSHKKIGGAPLNVALRLSAFNNDITLISAVGIDSDGIQLINFIEENDISTQHIQINSLHKTGTVDITLNDCGNASYTIEFPCAWDYIELRHFSKDKVKESDAFIYGSLICRNETSRTTLLQLLKVAKFKVFDVNLRPPYYDIIVLEKLMKLADFIKFNKEELIEICMHFNFNSNNLEQMIKFISKKTKTKTICVTKGDDGAVLFRNKMFFYCAGYKVNIKDTVGAGDAFLATIINEILTNKKPQNALDYACAVGALVASKAGANPTVTTAEIKSLKQ